MNDGRFGRLLLALQESDKRIERIIAGDPDIPGSRERSILGKLDRDHARLGVLEEADRTRRDTVKRRKKTLLEWLKDLIAPGLGAVGVLIVQWIVAHVGR